MFQALQFIDLVLQLHELRGRHVVPEVPEVALGNKGAIQNQTSLEPCQSIRKGAWTKQEKSGT